MDSHQNCVCVIKSLKFTKPTPLQAHYPEKRLALVGHVLNLHLN